VDRASPSNRLDDLDRLEEITSRSHRIWSAELVNLEAPEFGSVSSRQPSHGRKG
jgi:hypothetical protein